MKYRLGDICTITKGVTGIMKAIPGAYTLIALGEANKTHTAYQFDTKAVIIPLVSSTGHGHASMKRVKYYEGKFALGNILCAVVSKDENLVLAKYLHIYLHWSREELLVSQMKGMANVSLPMNKIADVMVTVPSIKKQLEIIELEKKLVDRELEVDRIFADQLNQLENLNQAILQEAVQGKLVQQDINEEPASELLKRIKAEKLKIGKKEKPLPSIKPEEIPFEIPDNWVWCRLGHVIYDTEGGKSPHCLNENVRDSEWGVIKTTAVQRMNFLEDENKVLPKGFVVFEQHKVVIDDVLITRAGPQNRVGIVCCVEFLSKNLILSDKTIRIKHPKQLIYSKYLAAVYNCPKLRPIISSKMVGMAKSQVNISQESMRTFLFPLPPLSEQKRIVAEIEKQFAKTKQLKEHIIASQQETEQLLKALLHQAFEVKEEKAIKKPKVLVSQPSPLNLDALAANPFEYDKPHAVNSVQDINWELAMMVACIENKLGIGYGDVGLQKNVFNASVKQPLLSKPYHFINSNFGTYSYELKDDLNNNPYLSKKSVKGKDVYAVNPKYKKQILDKLSAPENKGFVQAFNAVLSIYEHPFINKETDKIELFNTVLKIALDKKTKDLDIIYQDMKTWGIKQDKFKTKAEKFSKPDTDQMLKLLIAKGMLDI